MAANWSPADQISAILDGWMVLATGLPGGHRVIRSFGKCPFATDADAVAHIRKRAKAGSDLHRRALAITYGE